MAELVVGVIFKPDGCAWCPLRMLLRNALLRDTLELDLLLGAQLENERPGAVLVVNNWRAQRLIYALANRYQIARGYRHVLVASALGMERELHAAVFAVLFAVAVAGIEEVLDTLGVEWDKTKTVGDEFVSKNRAVAFNLDQVDGDGWDLGQHDAAQRVGERDVGILEFELDADRVGLDIHVAFRHELPSHQLPGHCDNYIPARS